MKESLKVAPIRIYNLAKYPAYNGEDPLNPSKNNYSKGGYYLSALFSVVGLFSFTNTNENPSSENPIKFSELGFPHTYASYGTGLPDRLDRESAVAIIDSVFKANGVQLEKNYQFAQGGVKFNVTAYNPDSQIGFVWLDNKNTTQDCYNSWGGRRYSYEELIKKDQKEYDKLINNTPEEEVYLLIDKFFKKLPHTGYYKLIDLKNHARNDEDLRKAIDKYISKHKDYSSKSYGKELLDRYDKSSVNISEMKSVINSKTYSIAPFSMYGSHSSYFSYHKDGGKKEALEKLETLVQDYIDWAKSEGRY